MCVIRENVEHIVVTILGGYLLQHFWLHLSAALGFYFVRSEMSTCGLQNFLFLNLRQIWLIFHTLMKSHTSMTVLDLSLSNW